MKRDLDRLAGEEFDLAIVGGGAYGACAAHEAAARGLRVALVERGDFGSGTSSQSLKVIHGGLRYLQHLDLRRTAESIAERRRLLRMAPHLVHPLACAMPVYGHGVRGREALAVGLWLNELAGSSRGGPADPERRIPRGRLLAREEMRALCPGADDRGLTAGALWWDAQAWSTERLLVAFLAAAAQGGAALANHVEATGLALERRPDGSRRVAGLELRDAAEGRELVLRSRHVLVTAGPWLDGLLARAGVAAGRRRFAPSKALNVAVRRIFSHDTAIALAGRTPFRDRDALLRAGSRLFFLVPWRDVTLVGTRHLSWEGDPDAFAVEPDDALAFLEEAREALPAARLGAADVVGVYGGMLPRAPGTPAAGEVQLQKDGSVLDHARGAQPVDGLVSVVGVKWTTARAVAERAVVLVARKLGLAAAARRAPTALASGATERWSDLVARARARGVRGLDDDAALALVRGHGGGAFALFDAVEADPALGRRVLPHATTVAAEIVHAAREEMALHLDDVILRRTDLHLARPLGRAALERCAELAGDALGWDPRRRAAEIDRAEAALRRFALLPEAAEALGLGAPDVAGSVRSPGRATPAS